MTDTKHNLPDPDQEYNQIVLWSAAVLTVVIVSGLFLWSHAGTAVFFDRVANMIASCF